MRRGERGRWERREGGAGGSAKKWLGAAIAYGGAMRHLGRHERFFADD